MFEDIEKFLKDNHKGRVSKDDKEDTKARLLKALRNEFGGGMGEVAIEEVSFKDGQSQSLCTPRDTFKRKIQGLADSLAYIASELKLKPVCLDSAGNKLKVGDCLKTPNGSFKTVLNLGFKFANLSHTEDQTQDDGVWFEHEIKTLKFIKE